MPLIDAATLVRLAHQNRYCVVQINTNGGTYDITRAIIEAAEEQRSPVILGAYEANLKYRGYEY
ncbi:MAG: Fructose-bisphosphate aldolase class-II, partial [Humisphaera sp.]|nr:Fructose-bisphosphate aldolase class-II [Humisphaera sp.]